MQLQSTDKVAAREPEERIYDRTPRWGRRFGIAFLLVIALMVGGFYAWTASGRNGLARQVAVYRAAGEPIELADFVVHGVADDDNAALALQEAAAAIDEKSDVWKAYEAFNEPFALPLTNEESTAIRAAVAANNAAFPLVDDAMRRKGVDWKIRYVSPSIQTLLPDLNHQRQLANLIVARARLNFQNGDHAAAIADLRRAAFIGRTVGHHPFIVGHLVSVGISALTCDALIEMTPGLKIGNAAGEARPGDVNALIADLLDDRASRESYRLGIYGERMSQLDTARCVADGRLSLANLSGAGLGVGGRPNPVAAVATFAAKPVALSDGRLMIDHTTALLRAFEASPDWPTYQAKAPPYPKDVANSMVVHILAKIMLPSMERATLTHFRNTAERRLTATALAVRHYTLDHGGTPPEKLDELVPKYLPAVPLDPFALTPQPIKYANDADKPRLYSVGEDAADGAGSELPTKQAAKRPKLSRWDKLDAVVHLRPQPRQRTDAGDEAEAEGQPATMPADPP
jgi:hypothetical protein